MRRSGYPAHFHLFTFPEFWQISVSCMEIHFWRTSVIRAAQGGTFVFAYFRAREILR
jgi:hypothetical protein